MKKLVPLLLLVVVLGGCGPEGPITITTSGVSPTVSSFEADPPSIAAGGSSTLKWNVVGATTVSIDQGIGSVALSGSRVVTPAATTVYTLTATNATGTSAMATAQVIVTGTSVPMPTPTVLPVISYFTANPPTIPYGGSTTLSWNVSSATSVTIEPGIGTVASAGTTLVSPATSTNYMLTATNAAGSVYMTAQVTITGAPAAGMPDLVITDVLRSGDTVTYTIKNQGDAVAGPSTSTLYVDTVLKANDGVGSLAAGESKTETFTGYVYSCTLPADGVEVRADTGGAVTENSEANNSYSESWSCIMAIGPMFTIKLPDLVIEDIWLVHEITGDKIYYKIKNKGEGDAGATTTSKLYIYPCFDPCPHVATDSVAPLAAGASRTEKFGSYNYTGGGWSVGVKVDTTGAAAESDEDNNSLSKLKADL